MDTPILFLIFNRPDKTQIVFERIKEARPSQLFVAADGPRTLEESVICEKTRQLVLDAIDWPCEVKTLFRPANLGCTQAVISAISWFFEQVERGIILEDDCLPDLSFFSFCTEMLEKYSSEEKIKHISGSNFLFGRTVSAESYYFSSISICWGWATWRRAWQEFELNRVETVSDQVYEETLRLPVFPKKHYPYWKRLFDYHRKGEDTIWDYRWKFNLWFQKGLAICPNINLVKNIGYGADATTSKGDNSARNKLANLTTHSMPHIIHPNSIEVNKDADAWVCKVYNPPLPFLKLIRHEVGKFIPNYLRSYFRKVFP